MLQNNDYVISINMDNTDSNEYINDSYIDYGELPRRQDKINKSWLGCMYGYLEYMVKRPFR